MEIITYSCGSIASVGEQILDSFEMGHPARYS
jgi:hypothetical protein